MSGRVLFARLVPLARRPLLHNVRPYPRRNLPAGINSLHHVPAVRPISFVRVLPKLFTKLATLGAAAGGATVAGLVYIQNQASAAGTYVSGIFSQAKDGAWTLGGGAYEGATDTLDRMKRGWETTREKVEVPEWLSGILAGKEGGDGNSGNGQGKGPEPKHSASGVAAGGAAAAAFGFGSSDDNKDEEKAARDDQMMLLTKKMIHIRTLLQSVGKSDSLTLPSIVVIGSQSSGKSSVLEAIVGHEFLPKGNNMVTRRPIELTLVNTPDAKAEYGEFPALGLGKISDFSSIQKTLTDLNLAVPAEECVSDDPIQLRIYSPNVPDLSLIDLPGYIQVTSLDQPPELKEKIAELCDKYIQPPNVILAISAADVDLANSTALRASRAVDPRGERTIGVITKMDLVDPDRGYSMLHDSKYSLRLGYVGVVARVPPSTTTTKLFNRGNSNISQAVMRNEAAFFTAHPQEFGPEAHVEVGMGSLRKKLMHVLEQTMASSLKSTTEVIHQELAEATYEFKVQYNDRPLSAETYLAESLDAFKHSFRGFAETFGRSQVRELIKQELDQQVLNLLAQRYWNKPIEDLFPTALDTDSLTDLPKADPEHPLWHLKLDASSAALTKLGIGRLATSVVANALQTHIDHLIQGSTFANHPFGRKAIADASTTILRDLSYDISDELEICIKPYKYRIELDDNEWAKGRDNITSVLKEELRVCEAAVKHVETEVGGRKKLRDVMGFIDRVRNGQVVLEGDGVGGAGGFSAALLRKGREAVFLRDRSGILKMRMMAVRSKQCANKANKYFCPEVFLDAVADKLTTTADLFLDAELLSKFYYSFPRELDARLGHGLSKAEIERFAREDPKIRRHLDVVKRKELLEYVLKEIDSLRQLEAREKRSARGSRPDREKRRGWGLF
ncbi:protein MGM1, mitochondrial precursor [Trichodelitschia bisporula]|uniref:dynamin GTPase n=1 Tax=Trichodelitschia bisporula TaxID=703511 RepID=A0A6G1HRY4_9PEZI|nr:protein MGM1, mitochondrial precursor [Trichodelitschia bisporula]